MSVRRIVPLLAVCVLAAPGSARADYELATVQRDTPIATYGGYTAWSQSGGDRYRLVYSNPGGTVYVPNLPTSSRPWDASIGPDANGRPNLIYQRCTRDGCALHRFNLVTERFQVLRSVSSPGYREATPALWGSTVAFTRRVRGCDVPYVKTLGSRAPSRRLLRGKCVTTRPGHLAIRGTRIAVSSIDLSGADDSGAGRKVSEVRRYSARRGGPSSAVLLRQGFGEESNRFGQPAIDEHHITTVRYGDRRPDAFVRVRTFGGSPAEIPAHVPLTGGFAKSSSGTSLYVEAQDDQTGECSVATPVPCRIIVAPHSPFGRRERLLVERITIEYVTDRPGRPRENEPLTFRGRLTRTVVQDGRVVRLEPVQRHVELKRRLGSPERFEDTPYDTTTDADGRYEIVVPPPIPREPWFTAVAKIDTWAGRGTVGQSAP